MLPFEGGARGDLTPFTLGDHLVDRLGVLVAGEGLGSITDVLLDSSARTA